MIVDYRDLAVFTRDGEGGNPLALIPFESVPSSRWQEVTEVIGYSETVFVEAGDPAVVHIYTPGGRIPFAGHPLVGTAYTLEGDVNQIRFDSGVADIIRGDDRMISVAVPARGEVREVPPPAYGIRAWIVDMPLPYLVVEAPGPEAVAALDPGEMAEAGGKSYVWAWIDEPSLVRARFFAVDVGVPEDPATGSAAVAFARAIDSPVGEVMIHQGDETGRPSTIRLSWDATTITIGGSVSDLGHSSVEV